VRLWGAVSWGLGAFVMGIINDHYGFNYNFFIFGILSTGSIVLVQWKMPNPKSKPEVCNIIMIIKK
jgi:predicted MFS family arabinose efflux permease